MLELKPLKDQDLAQVVAIENQCFALPKSAQIFRDDETKYLVAKEDGLIVGYIGVEDIAGEKHIINMAVEPKLRRKGIGKKLIEKIINNDDVFFLEVRPSNIAALGLYYKFGFKNVGLRKNYYQDNNEDALIMKREPQ